MNDQGDETRDELEQRLTTKAALLETLRELRQGIEAVVAEAGPERMEQPGSFDDLTLKDVIAHLNGWRLVTAARLEAAVRHQEPLLPWPAGLDEGDDVDEGDVDEINRWFYETNRDKSAGEVMRDSSDTFERCERAIAALPDEDLFQVGRFSWLGEYALGPGVVSGTYFHFYEDHEPEIRAWLSAG
jgi:hypothetical protein